MTGATLRAHTQPGLQMMQTIRTIFHGLMDITFSDCITNTNVHKISIANSLINFNGNFSSNENYYQQRFLTNFSLVCFT